MEMLMMMIMMMTVMIVHDEQEIIVRLRRSLRNSLLLISKFCKVFISLDFTVHTSTDFNFGLIWGNV